MSDKLTQARVKELFDYQHGELIRKVSTAGNVRVGDAAGTLDVDGYYRTMVDGKRYRTHCLIWLWHYGYMPENQIDHINHNRGYNYIENLREVTQTCNNRNTGNPKNNSSGVKGVCWDESRDKWVARIKVSSKLHYLGHHTNFSEAVCHRLAAEQALGWEGCDSSSPAFQYVSELIIARERK